MPSPGISLGDLAVFIAVLVMVAAFLTVVRSFLKRDETPGTPAETQRQKPEETRAEKPRPAAPGQVTPSQSAST